MTFLLTLLSIGSALSSIPAAWVAVIGTVFGGVALKVVEHWLAGQKKVDERPNLLAELKEVHERLDKTEAELDSWRTKYFDLRDEMSELRAQLNHAVDDAKKTL